MADHRLSQVSTASSTNSKRARAHIGPWQLGRTLGRGSSGRVRLAKHAETGKLAAVKIVPKAQMHDPLSGSSADSYGIEREVIIMKLIEHPNVMALYDVWENKGELYLVLEYIEGGELFDYLISRGRLSEREAIHYFRQICYGVAYCHRFNICHRDLKPENLLLDKSRNIKIADFGMAALESSDRLLETSCGSPHYASPEIVTGKTYHGAPSDIWSCGIILFALLTGHLPFDDDNIRQLLLKVQSGRYVMPHSLSVEARDLIARMLVVEPEERITMPEILSHPLLQKYPARHVPPENMGARMPSVDVSQPIGTVDREILRNLQTLWHRDTKETLLARLKAPEPNVEKTFYSLLLRFRQKHGLASRGATSSAMVRNRSAVSIRSMRSTRSLRSMHSARSGMSPSVRSVHSQRSALSKSSVRSSLSTQRHRPATSRRSSPRKSGGSTSNSNHYNTNSSTPAMAAAMAVASTKAKHAQQHSLEQLRADDQADMFAQLLDKAFNASAAAPTESTGLAAAQPRVVSNPVPPNIEPIAAIPANKRVVSLPAKALESTVPPTTPLQPQDLDLSSPGMLHSDALQEQSQFSPQETDNTQNYLLPMIFEEDRFADAIEEEMEMKLYKRGQQPMRPRLTTAASTAGSNSSGSQPGDNSQLQIMSLVPGESFFSYQPSAAAAAVSAPMRPAPRAPHAAPHGPRDLPQASQRKPVPIYTDKSAPVLPPTSANARRQSPVRKPLSPIHPGDLKDRAQPKPEPAERVQPAPAAAPKDDAIKVAKKSDTDRDRMRNWIRRFTPRRKASNEAAASSHPNPSRETKAESTRPAAPQPRQQAPAHRTEPDADKENALPRVKPASAKPVSTKPTSTQPTSAKPAPAKPAPAKQQPRSSYLPAEEPKQNWFMKLLSSPQSSSRSLMSRCQPIELRAMILEILNDWVPHGLVLYNSRVKNEPIVVSITRTNSLRLKAARIGIAISQSQTGSASLARLYLQRGSRTSFMTFTNEMERRLGALGALGLGSGI